MHTTLLLAKILSMLYYRDFVRQTVLCWAALGCSVLQRISHEVIAGLTLWKVS